LGFPKAVAVATAGSNRPTLCLSPQEPRVGQEHPGQRDARLATKGQQSDALRAESNSINEVEGVGGMTIIDARDLRGLALSTAKSA